MCIKYYSMFFYKFQNVSSLVNRENYIVYFYMTSLREAFGADYACNPGCNPGQFCSSRATCEGCPAGYACTGGGSKNMCPAGTYSAAGASECLPCPEGTYGDEAAASECISCPVGTYSGVVGCSSGNGCSCQLCPAGTYQDQEGKSSCTSCPWGEMSDAGASVCVDPGHCSANYLKDDGKKTQVGDPVACSGSGKEIDNTGYVGNAAVICTSLAPYCDGYIRGKDYGSCQTEPSCCCTDDDDSPASCGSELQVNLDACGGCSSGVCCLRQQDTTNPKFYCA